MTRFRSYTPTCSPLLRLWLFGLVALSTVACGGKKDDDAAGASSKDSDSESAAEVDAEEDPSAEPGEDPADEEVPSDEAEPTDEEEEEPTTPEPMTPVQTEDGICPEGVLIDVATETCLVGDACPLGYSLVELGGAQGCEATPWIDQFGTEAYDTVVAMERDLNGNTIAVGYTGGRLEGNGAEGFDVFVRVYDDLGEVIWTQQIASAVNEEAADLAIGPEGEIFVVGRSYAIGDVEVEGELVIGETEQNAFIYCLSPEGVTLWRHEIATDLYDEAAAVAVDIEGNSYVTGVTEGPMGVYQVEGESDLFLVKYDADGEELFVELYGSARRDFIEEIVVDDSGDILLGGYTEGSPDLGDYEGFDAFAMRLSADLELQWSRPFGTIGEDRVSSIAIGADGTVYVAGDVGGELGGSTFGGRDLYVRAYASDGELEWTRQYGTEGQDRLSSLRIGPEGLLYFAGDTMGSFAQDKAGKMEGFYGVLTPEGELVDIRDFGTAEDDRILTLEVDADGAIYLGGTVEAALEDQEHLGLVDAFVAKLAFD